MDPFSSGLSVLSAMITPAVLVSAAGTLVLSTSQRLVRVVDRVYDWSNQLDTLVHAEPPADPARIRRVFVQLEESARRARFLQWGLTAFYLAIGTFVADIILIGIIALVNLDAAWPPVSLGLLGAMMLLVGAALLIVESRLALSRVSRQIRLVRELGGFTAGAGGISATPAVPSPTHARRVDPADLDDD